MALIELNESVEDLGFDKFKPKADQSKYVSGFFLEGQHGEIEGFKGELDVAGRQRIKGTNYSHDGWQRFEENGKVNRVVHNGIRINGINLIEMFRPKDDVTDTHKLEGQLSQSRIDNEINLTKERLIKAGIRLKDGENEVGYSNPDAISGYEDAEVTRVTVPVPEIPTSKSRAWSPERKAEQARKMKEKHALKKANQHGTSAT